LKPASKALTAERSLRGRRRLQHSCSKQARISVALLTGTEVIIRTGNQKTAPLEAIKFAKENDQQ